VEKLIAKVVAWVVLVLIVVLVVWLVGDRMLTAIRAPVVAERDAAVDANKSLVVENQDLVNANRRLDKMVKRRTDFERGIDQRLKGVESGLKDLKAKSPAVKAWAETPIPQEMLQ
jgi:hypothetical protein